MSEQVLDPRMIDWLADGPVRAPAGSFTAIMTGVAGAAQERPPLRLAGRPVRVSLPRLAMAAAIAVVVTVAGGYLLREPIQDALAPERAPGDLLVAFPETRTVLEASGGPSSAEQRTVVGTLPGEAVLIIAADCSGPGPVAAQVVDPSAIGAADGTGDQAEPTPWAELPVPCGGGTASMHFSTLEGPGPGPVLRVVAGAGTTWRVAVGEMRSVPGKPTFGVVQPGEAELLLIEGLTAPVAGPPERSAGIGFDPAGAESVTLLVQCLGDPITVRRDGEDDDMVGVAVARLTCEGSGAPQPVSIEVDGPGWARAASDGFTWVRLSAVAAPAETPSRPEAPALPDGLGDVLFADGDRENVAFGSLGGNTQTVIRLDQSVVGKAGRRFVAIAHPDDAGTVVLELWAIADAAPVRTLAALDGATVFDAWVDETHEQVFYGTTNQLGVGEFRRVGFDGTGDTLVASVSIAGLREARGDLAADDAQFVAQWCPTVGACERAVYDTATGEVTRIERTDDGACDVLGVVAGRIVTAAPACDAAPGQQRITAQDVGGGPITTLLDGSASGAVIMGSDGPGVLLLRPGDTQSVVEVVGIDGGGRREVARIDHEAGLGPYLSTLRLPAGDWVLLAGPLADTPTVRIMRPIPVLLNVVTGQQIPLPNLPGG